MKNTAVNTTSFVSTFVSGTVSAAAIVFMALLGSVQVFAQGDAAAGAEKSLFVWLVMAPMAI